MAKLRASINDEKTNALVWMKKEFFGFEKHWWFLEIWSLRRKSSRKLMNLNFLSIQVAT
jgi:hypothetical protein